MAITAVTEGGERCRPCIEPGAQRGRGDAPEESREADAAAAAPPESGRRPRPVPGRVELSFQHHGAASQRRAKSRRTGSAPAPASAGARGAGCCLSPGLRACGSREGGSASGRATQPPVSLPQLRAAAAASPAGDRRRRLADPARRPAGRTHRRTHTRTRAHTHSQLAAATAAMLTSRSGKFPAGLGRGPPCSQVSASRTRRASPGSSAG